MNSKIVAVFLLCTAALLGGTRIDRDLFTLELPLGWTESKPTTPAITIVDSPGAPPAIKAAHFFAGAKDASAGVAILIMPTAHGNTAQRQFDRMCASFRSTSKVTGEVAFTQWAGRRGIGTTLLQEHPYPIYTAIRLFAFEEDGLACSLQMQASDANPAEAQRKLKRAERELEQIARSLVLKPRG